MRSALYYPHTTVRSESVLKSSLLLWDHLHAIAPFAHYQPEYGNRVELARAWEMIGKFAIPTDDEKELAHERIAAMLAGDVPPAFSWSPRRGRQPYEIWPQKFAASTWDLLRSRGMTSAPLENGDFPFIPMTGVLVMAKLADAIAGDAFARVTDRAEAFALTPDRSAATPQQQAHLIAVDVLDIDRIPLRKLINFREREQKERSGRELTDLRHAYADMISAHAEKLKGARTERQAVEMNHAFRADLERDLRHLREELDLAWGDLLLKPLIVAGGVVTVAAASGLGLAAGAALLGTAAIGKDLPEIANKVADMVMAGFSFSRAQRTTMAQHPMAYLYEVSRT